MTETRSRKSRQGECGAIIVPFLLSIGSILIVSGALVESSLVLYARNKLFNDAESALLAAANLYDPSWSKQEREEREYELEEQIKSEYSTNTYLESDRIDLDFDLVSDGKLVMTATKQVNLLFVPGDADLVARVAASVPQPVGELNGAAPLAMQEPPGGFVFGDDYEIKQGAGDGTTGNFGGLALSGPGSSNFEDDLTYGYPGSIQIGDVLNTQTGDLAGATRDGVEARLATPSTADDVIIVIITEDAWPHGSSVPITVAGFAAFRLISVVDRGRDVGTITAEFIKYKTSAEPAASDCDCDNGTYTKPKLIYYTP